MSLISSVELLRGQFISQVLNEEILRCLGFESSANVIRYSSSDIKTQTMLTHISNELTDGEAYRYEIGVNKEKTFIHPLLPDTIPFTLTENLPFPWFTLSPDDVGNQEKEMPAYTSLYSRLPLCPVALALWAACALLARDRAGVMHAHQVAAGGDCRRFKDGNQANSNYASSFWSAWDFLEQLIALGSAHVSGDSKMETNCRLLESGLIKGSVGVEHGN